MKVSSNAWSLNDGDVLYAKKQFFEAKTKTEGTPSTACQNCSLLYENCHDYVDDFCPSTRYYKLVRITPKIERALGVALLQGEVLMEESPQS